MCRLRLFFVFIVLLGCFPALSFALGLGEIKLKSHLNQPLLAEIELLQVRGLSSTEILPGLASREDFGSAGVERGFFLTGMRFEVKLRPDGTGVVIVSTSKAVREPFLNFLIEVLWPAGRLLREYTLLMDPPIYSERINDKVNLASRPSDFVSTQGAQRGQQQKRIRRGTVPARSESMVGADNTPTSSVSKRFLTSDYADGGYRTRAGDTLWKVATALVPSADVSVRQTMLALQRNNPDAFLNNNINLLKKGQVLRAVTREEALQLDDQEALAEVFRQNKVWKSGLANRRLPEQSLSAAPMSDQNIDEIKVSKLPASGHKLTLASADNASVGDSGQGGIGGENQQGGSTGAELDLLQEELDREKSVNTELVERVTSLENQVRGSDKIITLQRDQIAELTAKLEKLKQEQANLVANESSQSGGMPQLGQQQDNNASQRQNLQALNTSPEPETSGFMALLLNPMYLIIVVLLVALLGLITFFTWRRREELELEEELGLAHQYDTGTGLTDVLSAADEKSDEQTVEVPLAHTEAGQTASSNQPEEDVIGEAEIYMAYGRFDQAAEILTKAIDSNASRTEWHLKLMEVYVEANDVVAFEQAQSRFLGQNFGMQFNAKLDEMRAKLGLELSDEDQTITEGEETSLTSEFESETVEVDHTDMSDDREQADMSLDFELDDANVEDEQLAGEINEGMAITEANEGVDDTDVLSSLDDLESNLTSDFKNESGSQAIEQNDDEDDSQRASPLFEAGELDFQLEEDSGVSQKQAEEALPVPDANNVVESLEDSLAALDNVSQVGDAESDLVDSLDADIKETDFNVEDMVDLAADIDNAFGETEGSTGSADSLSAAENSLSSLAEDILSSDDQNDDTLGQADILDETLTSELTGEAGAGGSELDAADFISEADEAATKLDLARAYIDMGDRTGAKDILDEVLEEGDPQQQEEAKELLQKVG